MSTVRPIVTIAILIAVGAFLYVKINEGPVTSVTDAMQASPSDTISGVPSLAATNVAPSTATTAPAWPPSAAGPTDANATSSGVSAPPLSPVSPPIADVATANDAAHGFPAIPELPPVAAAGAPSPAPAMESNPLGHAAAELLAGDTTTIPQAAAATTTPQGSTAVGASPTPDGGTLAGATTPIPTSPSTGLDAQTDAAQNPLRQSAPAENATDRYGQSIYAQQSPVTGEPPVELSFAASWPAIQSALGRGELARAHELLSRWYGEPSLTPSEAEKVESLLSQLAGTVIYSTDHQLLPARVVKEGESLETIAKEYNVPWQLLAKINGIPSANQLRPGQELKVLQGPFSAVVDLRRSELALQLNGRYAGKFPVTVPVGTVVAEGEWLVDQKLVAPGNVAQASYTPQPSTADHAIVLRSESSAAVASGGPTLAIASSSTPTAPGANPASIQLSAADAEELSDILSIGSRVVIRR